MITAKDYQDAINVQNACNLAGPAQSLAEIIKRIETDSTDSRNQHPIVKLFVYKMFILAFPDQPLPDGFDKPYHLACDAANGNIVIP